MNTTERPSAITDGIKIEVAVRYVEEASQPNQSRFLFAYQVTIENVGIEPAQLVTRHWIITDAEGRVEEVRGPGVVGETPKLAPGQSYTYQSFCPLATDFGRMEGTYQMVRPDGTQFDAEIPAFELARPYSVN